MAAWRGLFRRVARANAGTIPWRRCFTSAVSKPANKVQVYISTTHDPYVNLSVEHHLLQKSPEDSIVLFLYTNRPSVVIGRNQNPWLEVNLGLLRKGLQPLTYGYSPASSQPLTKTKDGVNVQPRNEPVQLVRRRSGGGTVFHDMGNVNYSVICPPAVFDRDRHAQMVVTALTSLGAEGVRVNERHDIVQDVDVEELLDAEQQSSDGPNEGTELGKRTFKISGSAYKLTRLRSLHHGTCLLTSPNLHNIGPLLRSPAAPYILARGVESVRSPVRNVGAGIQNADFEDAVVEQFEQMYGEPDIMVSSFSGEEALADENIKNGVAELSGMDWTFAQTPQFQFSTYENEKDPRPRPPLPNGISNDVSRAVD
jgi:lipoate---protein ligase